MSALHVYFPAADARDAEWAFAHVRGRVSAEYSTPTNPFTKHVNLKGLIDGAYSFTVFFETGEKADEDLRTIRGDDSTGFSRVRVLFAPDPDDAYGDVAVQLMDLFESSGPVLVYGVGADEVFVDTLA